MKVLMSQLHHSLEVEKTALIGVVVKECGCYGKRAPEHCLVFTRS